MFRQFGLLSFDTNWTTLEGHKAKYLLNMKPYLCLLFHLLYYVWSQVQCPTWSLKDFLSFFYFDLQVRFCGRHISFRRLMQVPCLCAPHYLCLQWLYTLLYLPCNYFRRGWCVLSMKLYKVLFSFSSFITVYKVVCYNVLGLNLFFFCAAIWTLLIGLL